MNQQSKKLQNPKEKVSKYLANIGFASRRGIANLFSEKTILLNGKKAKQADLLKDGDTPVSYTHLTLPTTLNV